MNIKIKIGTYYHLLVDIQIKYHQIYKVGT